MKKITVTFFILISSLTLTVVSCAQTKPPASDRPNCIDEVFDQKVSQMISFSVPIIGVSELKDIQNEVYIFDTRKKEEYDVSHIENAKFLGYDDFTPERIQDIPKDAKIILYCSIGYRSEKIGEKLSSLGYSNVYNLYGSIFEWINQGNVIVDKDGNPTKKIHTYNKQWSKWVDEKKAEKVW